MANLPDDDVGNLDTRVGTSNPPPAPVSGGAPPQRIGQFVVGDRLGRGGMATVYLGTEEGSGRKVALKLMNSELAQDPAFVERFKAEARATQMLQHPNIVAILGWGELNGAPYMATEFCDGGTIGSLMDALGEVPAPVAIEVMAQFLAGLGHAHQRGIVHRDLKPENLLLTKAGEVKLADFGIARTTNQTRMTNTGMLVGTASYMSPEQARGDFIDNRSDLYSAGIIFYELLAGMNPFSSENPATSLTKILTNAATPLVQARPTVAAELEAIIDRLMAFDALDRYTTAEEALADLAPLIEKNRQLLPRILYEAQRDPRMASEIINRTTAVMLLNEAKPLVAQGAPQQRAAAMKLYAANHADPQNTEVQALFTQLSQSLKLNFGPPTNPKINELEGQLRAAPTNLQLLTQLSNLYKLEGNVLRASAYLRRYVRLKPEDGYVAGQLTQLTGEVVTGTSTMAKPASGPSTAELMAGIKTGGFKAAPAGPTGAVKPGTAQTSLPAKPPVASMKIELPTVEVQKPWVAFLSRYGVYLFVAVVLLVGIRMGLKFVESSTEDVDVRSRELRNALHTTPAGTTLPGLTGVNGIPNVPHAEDTPAQTEQVVQDLLMSRARGAARAGNYADAISGFESVIKSDPESGLAIEAAFQIAQASMNAKNYNAAREAFEKYVAKYPETAAAIEAHLRIAQCQHKALDFSGAEAGYTKFIEEHARSSLFPEALLSRAELRHERGQDEQARGDLITIKAIDSAPSGIRNRAARLLEQLPPLP